MHTEVMSLDCPAYTDRHGTTRCGLPAAVESRYTVSSTDGPQESVKIGCPRGHWFNGPIEALTREQHSSTAAATTTPPAGPGGPTRKLRWRSLWGNDLGAQNVQIGRAAQ